MEIVFNKTKKILLILALTLVFISFTTVIFAADDLELNIKSAVIYDDSKFALSANKTVTWSSSNENIATVNSKGEIIAKGRIGIVTITAKASNGETETCKIRIKKKMNLIHRLRGISLNATSLTLYKGKTILLTPDTLVTGSVSWTSSNKDVVNLNHTGLARITGKKEGITTITATTAKGKKATCIITVKELDTEPAQPTQPTQPQTVNVTGVTLNKTSATIEKGKTLNLTATVNPTNATNKTVTWKSDKTNVATVDSSGKVTAKAPGTATITATVGGKTATCKITVPDPYKYSFNGNTYKLAITSNKLDDVLDVIDEKKISQRKGGTVTKSKCIRIATYHNYLLLGKISVGSANLTDAISESYYNNLNSKKQEEKNGRSGFYAKIKSWLDNGYPVRLKVDPNEGNLHYVTVVGYKDDASGLDDLLMVGSYSGTLISGTGSADVEKIHPDYYANIYKK